MNPITKMEYHISLLLIIYWLSGGMEAHLLMKSIFQRQNGQFEIFYILFLKGFVMVFYWLHAQVFYDQLSIASKILGRFRGHVTQS